MSAEKGLKIEVVTAGNCMMCGKEIKVKVLKGTNINEIPNIFFCEECQEKIQMESAEFRKKQEIIDLMRKMPLETLSIAYLYAKNYKEYGADVTRTWLTATENASLLERAYRKGYYDGSKMVINNLDTMNGN